MNQMSAQEHREAAAKCQANAAKCEEMGWPEERERQLQKAADHLMAAGWAAGAAAPKSKAALKRANREAQLARMMARPALSGCSVDNG